jgi:ribosomal protein S18 acetylase RimI-like enzyme
MGALSRVGPFLEDFARLWRETGIRAAFRLVRKRVYDQNVNLFYELRTTGVEPDLPHGWCVKVVASHEDAAVGFLLRAGGESELPYFRRNAVAYVLCIGDEVVARRWHFPQSPLAQWLGPDAAYSGKSFVKPEWRGQGIAGRLLAYMAARLPIGSKVVMEVDPSNVSSQKCLVKAGCVLLGRLHTTECFARLIRVRLDGSPLPAIRTRDRQPPFECRH